MARLVLNRFQGRDAAPGGKTRRVASPRFNWIVGGAFVLLAVSRLFPMFDHTTPIAPFHPVEAPAALAIGLVLGISAMVVVVIEKGIVLWRRIALAIFSLFAGTSAGFLGGDLIVKTIEGLHDFPAAQSQTSTVVWPITQLHQTTGRSSGEYVKTQHGTFRVQYSDYTWMKAQRPAGYIDPDARTLTINGYFCAKLPLQTAGKAARIMLGHDDVLPRGSVEVCPPSQ